MYSLKACYFLLYPSSMQPKTRVYKM